MFYLLLKTKTMVVPCHRLLFKYANFRILQKPLIIRTAGELLRCLTRKIDSNVVYLYHVTFCQFGLEIWHAPYFLQFEFSSRGSDAPLCVVFILCSSDFVVKIGENVLGMLSPKKTCISLNKNN